LSLIPDRGAEICKRPGDPVFPAIPGEETGKGQAGVTGNSSGIPLARKIIFSFTVFRKCDKNMPCQFSKVNQPY
jgi:hypothetical protein